MGGADQSLPRNTPSPGINTTVATSSTEDGTTARNHRAHSAPPANPAGFKALINCSPQLFFVPFTTEMVVVGGESEGERGLGCVWLREDTVWLRTRTVHVVPFHSDAPHARSAGPVRKKKHEQIERVHNCGKQLPTL